MNFVGWIERHRRSLVFIAFALAAAGVYAAITLPVGLFPTVSFPRIRITIDSSSMPAKQMLIEVTEPIEEVTRAVPGATGITSISSRGSAEIFVDFPWGSDMRQALLGIDAAVAQALPNLPSGTRYIALQMSPNAIMPFVSYALISNEVSPAELRRLAKYQIVPLLTGIAGVRRVGILGGQTPEVQVAIDPPRLEALHLTLADVTNAISAGNTLKAVGRLEDNNLLYLAVSNNAFDSVAAVANLKLRNANGGIVRLGDIASVSMGSVPQWLMVDENGQPAVTVDVYQQDSADSLTLEKEVQQRLDEFMKTQPQSIHFYKWYDQTELVRSSIGAVAEAIGIGLVFAAAVVFGFLRNWRVTLVAMMVVPLSLLITILLLAVTGMSFNIMTLGGIAAAIGLLIDDVIVMIEQIARRAGAPGLAQPQTTVLLAAREFFAPLLGSSLATIVIFLPLAFLSGLTGAFFKFLALTMAMALIISYLLTTFTVPLLARAIIDFAAWEDPQHGRETWLRRMHGRLLDGLFARPWLIVLVVAVLAGAGYLAYGRVGTGFLPKMDEGGFVLDYQTAPGTSLTETNRELEQVESILKKDPHVYTFSRRTGAGLGGDLKESYQGDFFVRLTDSSKRPPSWTVMDDITSKITELVPGIRFDTHQLLNDMIGDMVGRPQPIVVELSANDPTVLPAIADKVAQAIAKVPGIEPASINNGVVPAGDALDIHVDPAAAAMAGVTPAEIETQLYHYLFGAVVTTYLGAEQPVGVRLRLDPSQERLSKGQLTNLTIRAPNGQIFPLDTVARVKFIAGQPEITRNNLAQVVAVTAQIGGGYDLGSTAAAVKAILDQPGFLPAGVYYQAGGAYKQQQLAVHGMIRVFAAALIGEIILLLFLYEQFLIPIIIIVSSLISTSAVFVGLWLTDVELNITAMMGMVMIVGIATEMAIFLVSEYEALAREMRPLEALREAALNRMRPIVMSTLAMILALLPLGAAISGSGDQMLQPLATAIIAGVIVQLPLVLLALPVIIGLTTRR
ncbi:efflux RND transporter permease subunit [Bradyrhizobium sp.]|uniref:efflux RND transporter permease subunit n=1 Tax=Bradyrhizobium sp. TaxID=376 RepID=UPI00262BFDE9|nr:efflux RND transporter permease subunit [Bradyrhizobium sp.]